MRVWREEGGLSTAGPPRAASAREVRMNKPFQAVLAALEQLVTEHRNWRRRSGLRQGPGP
jgi:hypothetical protein